MDFKARLKSKPFWVATISAVTVISQQMGVTIFPDKFNVIANAILGLFILLGVVVDTSTLGISDKKE